MKRFVLPVILLTGIIAGCSSDENGGKIADSTSITTTDTTLIPAVPVQEKVTECYIYTKNKDTATLTLNTQHEELTGTLNYRLFEKDANKGTISGEVKGDTIIAEYIFDAEGMRSVREVVFLRRDGKLYEGYGDVEEKKSKTVFTNRAKLKFGDAIVFSKTDCK